MPRQTARYVIASTLRQILGVLLLMAATAQAAVAGDDLDAAMGLVRDTTSSLLAAVQSGRARIRDNPDYALELVSVYVAPHIDMERSAKRVLGGHWRVATAKQRKRFIREFRKLLLRTYATAIADSPGVNIEYERVRERRKHEAEVRTRVPRETGDPVAVYYRLHNRSGSWKLYDVTIAGISLLATYRSSFGQLIKRDGIDALIDAMAQKNGAHSA